jgi:Gas vesicle synthesis protein GvpL/GvpF
LTTRVERIKLGLMAQTGVYLYGFAIPDLVRDFDHPGHAEIGAVRLVDLGGLTAIVSSVPPGEIESGLSKEPPDAEWVVPRALHHEAVVQAALARGPVLPVRFGCVFRSEQALEDSTGRHRDLILCFLDEISDQEEWTLKAFLDESLAVAAVLETAPELASRYRRLPTAPGTRYFLEKKLREEARLMVHKGAKVAAEELYQAVAQTGVAIKRIPLRASESHSHPLLLKLALLIPRGKLNEVIGAADQAAARRVPLVIEPSGPWPPYNFCPGLGEPPR